jgi:hypothetical protein
LAACVVLFDLTRCLHTEQTGGVGGAAHRRARDPRAQGQEAREVLQEIQVIENFVTYELRCKRVEFRGEIGFFSPMFDAVLCASE